jgi:hypothetical protein
MTYAFARIGAVVSMRVEDYFANGKRWWVRLHEKSGKRHEMPAHPQARNGDSPGLLSPAAYRSFTSTSGYAPTAFVDPRALRSFVPLGDPHPVQASQPDLAA